jgi:hypothetical protein
VQYVDHSFHVDLTGLVTGARPGKWPQPSTDVSQGAPHDTCNLLTYMYATTHRADAIAGASSDRASDKASGKTSRGGRQQKDTTPIPMEEAEAILHGGPGSNRYPARPGTVPEASGQIFYESPTVRPCAARARSHCRFVRPLIRYTPDLLAA